MRIPAVIVLLFPLSVQAQVSYPAKQAVTVALTDADYALRRFEEVTARVELDRLKLPDSTRPKEQQALRLTRSEVEEARTTISRIEQSEGSARGIDLLNVDEALVDSVALLYDLRSNPLNFGNQSAENKELALELARTSDAAVESQAKLSRILSQRIAVEEEELATCRVQPSASQEINRPQPKVIDPVSSWGTDVHRKTYYMEANTDRLGGIYANTHRLLMVIRAHEQSVDYRLDHNIAKSELFTIGGGTRVLEMPLGNISAKRGIDGFLVMIPARTPVEQITCLEDIKNFGGILLSERGSGY